MEMKFTSYTKKIEGITFYFVKQFIVFGENDKIPPVQAGFGMHKDFDTACSIAGTNDSEIKKKLLEEINSAETIQARVIDMNGLNHKAVNNW